MSSHDKTAAPGVSADEGRFAVTAIGVVHSPHTARVEAPRQPRAAEGSEGSVELFPGRGYEDALTDIALWDHLWLVVWFHKNVEYRPKVQPPRSERKRGVFATRAPYRPNPIGLSAVRLMRVEGLNLFVSGLDLLEGTPLLDLKPYVPYADAIPDANHGWLSCEEGAAPEGARPNDPIADYEIGYEVLAATQLAFLTQVHAVELKPRLEAALRLGPSPHAYRRIRKDGDGYRLALKDWRVRFSASGRSIVVLEIKSGYRPRELFMADGQAPQVHRDFVGRWPTAIDP